MSPDRHVLHRHERRLPVALVLAICAWALAVPVAGTAPRVLPGDLRLSQVYGGGGNAGAPLQCDFVEFFNAGADTVSLDGWSVQYVSGAGTAWQAAALGGTVAPGRYHLVQAACGSAGGALPAPDGGAGFNLAAASGKVALVSGVAALTGQGLGAPEVVDFVGYGTASACEGSPPGACTSAAPALGNALAALRAGDGCVDTDHNQADFAAAPPAPRNGSTAAHLCLAPTDTPPPGATRPATPATPAATAAATATPTPAGGDRDGDGVADTVEAAAPHGGDGNADGLADADQPQVASLPNAVDGAYLTLATGEGRHLAGVAVADAPAPGEPALAGQSFPVGLIGFRLSPMPAPPSSVTVTLRSATALTATRYWRRGPEPDRPAAHWYRFDPLTGAPPTGAAILSPSRVDLTFVDGARGDDDLAVDGQVVDVGGPASGPLPVELARFSARAGRRGVVLGWATVSELRLLGFRVWWLGARGRAERVGPALVPARGGELGGATYALLDPARRPAGAYWLESVDTTGTTRWHGPLARPASPAGR
jgi:hypothetical protein